VGIPVRTTTALAAAGVALAASVALSGPSSKVAWTVETVRLVRSGDVAHGKKLNGDCAGCHGDAGTTDTPDVPNLAGQDALYTFKQLSDYKEGTRASPIMGEAVKPLSEKDMADLAAFYASLPPAPGAAGLPAGAAAVLPLTSIGDGARLMPACDACHGKRGAGDTGSYGMPKLSGQKFDDMATQLTTFRSGERANDVYGVMRILCKHLTDAEIAGLAAYYSGKAGTPPATPAPAK
jgi:cytochrome c553